MTPSVNLPHMQPQTFFPAIINETDSLSTAPAGSQDLESESVSLIVAGRKDRLHVAAYGVTLDWKKRNDRHVVEHVVSVCFFLSSLCDAAANNLLSLSIFQSCRLKPLRRRLEDCWL